jgi:2-oxoglutarate dehydrogenase E1 component
VDPNVFETANAGFAQAIYEEYLRDPQAVSPEWRRLFESGVIGEQPEYQGNGASHAVAPVLPPPAPAAGPVSTAEPADAPVGATLIKGPAARLAAYMNESLKVPTATTFRQLPVAVLEARRKDLNDGIKAAGRSEKISFTHLIGYALVLAAKRHIVMCSTYVEAGGNPHRVDASQVNLGLAVDVERKDGSRGLVVPVIHAADAMDFATFHSTYEGLVEKARTNKLMPDAFAGATMSLTNPGGLGTSASVPRLMAGQGSIIAVGSIAYPPEFATTPAERIRDLGIAKVMTVTSTYDHRIIQGAESGEFLRTLDGLLQGSDGFYESVFTSLGLNVPERRKEPASVAALTASPGAAPSRRSVDDLAHVAAAMALVKAHRTHGHLAARLDPLGSEPPGDPALDPERLGLTTEIMQGIPASVLRIAVPGATLFDALPHLQATYCGTIAYEVEHIASHEERVWLRQMIESGAHRTPLTAEEKRTLLQRLTQVEVFEKFLHKAYLGQKRFSIEGLDIMVPMLDGMIELAVASGAREVVLGMAHRGRLNVLAHTVGKPYQAIFAEFEGNRPVSETDEPKEDGTGDVKYHHGAEGAYRTTKGQAVTVALAANPSHLEFVGPVVDGRARAAQTQRRGREAVHDSSVSMPVVIHGDAAFAAQGVVAEMLNLGALAGYRTGGTMHLIANNQVGFTTDVRDTRSTRYASDLAKGFDIPIIHVNADDPEACVAAVRLAMMYRDKFHEDAVIDLVGYRRHGHNEGDEPTYTQPLMYARIKDHPTVREIYAGVLGQEGVIKPEEGQGWFDAAYQRLTEVQQSYKASLKPDQAESAKSSRSSGMEIETTVPADLLVALNDQLLTWGEGFQVNPKLKKQLERRRAAIGPGGGIDWAHAEALALASLLTEGTPIRLTGQDTERGTFSQRHLVLHDVATGQKVTPMQQLPGAQAPFEVYNSPLSELATIGFEYGYSAAAPEVLVLWEAQFGDFINGAQVMVDQFITSGLSKWGLTTRLTLLLPHGYEGQGPEHSSGRLERFLQLAAEGNIRVANCTTPAQYFHLLRRQGRVKRQRPLVIMTPKSLLRHPAATSTLDDLARGSFQCVIDDPAFDKNAADAARVVMCSGKLYYELLAEAEKMTEARPPIIRLEQLYTFPAPEMREVLGRYTGMKELVWAQEEPRNMGAWRYLEEKIRDVMPSGVKLRYAGRPERASPAEGYPQAHALEQKRIIGDALGGKTVSR